MSTRDRLVHGIALAPFAVVTVLHLGARLADADGGIATTKWLLMPALILGVVLLLALRAARPSAPSAALLVAALLLSWVGDVTLPSQVGLGLTAFLLAHLAYLVLFWRDGAGRPRVWSLVVLPWFGALLLLLGTRPGALLPLVIAYGAVLAAAAITATRVGVVTTLGAMLFVVSDSMLALRLFAGQFDSRLAEVVILATYLAAQVLLVAGALHPARRHPQLRPAVGTA